QPYQRCRDHDLRELDGRLARRNPCGVAPDVVGHRLPASAEERLIERRRSAIPIRTERPRRQYGAGWRSNRWSSSDSCASSRRWLLATTWMIWASLARWSDRSSKKR